MYKNWFIEYFIRPQIALYFSTHADPILSNTTDSVIKKTQPILKILNLLKIFFQFHLDLNPISDLACSTNLLLTTLLCNFYPCIPFRPQVRLNLWPAKQRKAAVNL